MAASARKMIQHTMFSALDQVAKQDGARPWVVRSIRARIPELAQYAVRKTSQVKATGRLHLQVTPPQAFSEADIRKAIESYTQVIVTQAAVHGRHPTQRLLQSKAWPKTLPCCSKFPIWPACRRNC